MKKRCILSVIVIVFSSVLVSADPLLYLNFDQGQIIEDPEKRTWQTGSYLAGADEVLPEGARILLKYFDTRGMNQEPPVPADTSALPADPVQGGKALSVTGGGQSQGALIVLEKAVPAGDITFEIIWMTHILDSQGNAFKFQYVASNEWPGGGQFHWAFRRAFDQPMNFTVFQQNGPEIRLFCETPIEVDRWYHYAGVLDYNEKNPEKSELRFYVDGELQASAPYDAGNDQWSLGASHSLYGHCFALGYSAGQDANPYDNRGLTGAIDACAVTSEALDPENFFLPVP